MHIHTGCQVPPSVLRRCPHTRIAFAFFRTDEVHVFSIQRFCQRNRERDRCNDSDHYAPLYGKLHSPVSVLPDGSVPPAVHGEPSCHCTHRPCLSRREFRAAFCATALPAGPPALLAALALRTVRTRIALCAYSLPSRPLVQRDRQVLRARR